MHLKTLTLNNYRNFTQVSFSFKNGINIICGDNGTGKTNILEAISLLSDGRGLRGAKSEELKKLTSQEIWSVFGKVENDEVETNLGTGENPNSSTGGRIVKIDGEKQSSRAALSEYFACIWLTPQMQNFFIEGATERRKFYDRLVKSYISDHAQYLAKYDNLSRQRLKLLKTNCTDKIWLKSIERKMAENAIIIASNRVEIFGLLCTYLSIK